MSEIGNDFECCMCDYLQYYDLNVQMEKCKNKKYKSICSEYGYIGIDKIIFQKGICFTTQEKFLKRNKPSNKDIFKFIEGNLILMKLYNKKISIYLLRIWLYWN